MLGEKMHSSLLTEVRKLQFDCWLFFTDCLHYTFLDFDDLLCTDNFSDAVLFDDDVLKVVPERAVVYFNINIDVMVAP